MKLLNVSIVIIVLFLTGTIQAAERSVAAQPILERPWLTMLKGAFDQCKGPRMLTMDRIGTLPADCQRLIVQSIPNPQLYQALARREQRVLCSWAARTF